MKERPMPVMAAVDDLFFGARISETARQTGVPVQVIGTAQFESALAELLRATDKEEVKSVIVDLNARDAVGLIQRLKNAEDAKSLFIVGFASHVASDRIAAARDAGCDQVMARSAFTRQLPELLRRLCGQHEAVHG
jgi:DNA-binding NarL/FixJ family response regulator